MEKIKTTKYFGDVELNYEVSDSISYVHIHTSYKDKKVNIHIEDFDLYEDKLELIWECIDKYMEINEIAKKAIVNNYLKKNKVVKEFIEDHFKYKRYGEALVKHYGVKNINELDIKTFVEKMDYPDVSFTIEDGIITIIVEYYIFEWALETTMYLLVLMDEKLNIKKLERDYGS